MLKQTFDKEQLVKILTPADVYKWRLLSQHGSIDTAIVNISNHWRRSELSLSPLKSTLVKRKKVFSASIAEDDLSIRLLDRFIRRIYKVRQSDRNRIIRQLLSLLKDSGKYHVIRLDIKDCYESIPFQKLITKMEDDLILSPECMKILRQISTWLKSIHNYDGLPRGLSISPTLAELYLEKLDNEISASPSVIYSARYVDDIVILVPQGQELDVEKHIDAIANEMGFEFNKTSSKYFSGPSSQANFDFLGYSIQVSPANNKPNKVMARISSSKLNKIKTRIITCLSDYKRQNNFSLLKRRLEYLSMLKIVKKGRNGNLLAGIAHNYQYVTDEFECLKSIDGFLLHHLNSARFQLSLHQLNAINKITFYGNVRNKKVGNFSRIKTIQIMQVWKDV
ncbi:antiviral reverse transcriptase Drt3a [Aeromonas veronii]|uniref:antiviral reverse transcriptase Drt3a n=1 Tax=Aeromonas TaxID=642 RepID=UPI0021E97D23|nr:antiviral reverse transcriptase Drt3a [Aeromonas veronii]MCV3284125.1 hypothetical protein [Aeromonas veronii]